MKITGRIRETLSLSTIILLFGTGLAVADTDSYAESFETYAVGSPITNVSGWTANEPEGSVIVSTNYTASYQGQYYPIDYDHAVNTKVLEVKDGVMNTITAGDSLQTNWLDVVLKPVYSENAPDDSTVGVGTVAAIYFNTNGYPVVMHTPSNNTTYVEWVTITNIPPVSDDQWIRLTIAADFQSTLMPPAANLTRMYRVFINGHPLSNEVAYVSGNRTSALNGSWFGNRRGSAARDPFTNVIVNGTGFIDDLVVANALTLTAATMWTIEATAGENGSITPSGSVSVAQGSSKTFTITPGDDYVVDAVVVVENGATNNLGSVTTYTFTNVSDVGSIDASFVIAVAPSGDDPPASWLLNTGIDSADLDSNLRGDGMTPREAWLASTDPTNTTFSFRITDVRHDGGTNYVEWVSVFVDTNLPPFGILARTNLLDTTYDQRGTRERKAGVTPHTPYTNMWWEAAPAYPIFYRLAATNAPSGD